MIRKIHRIWLGPRAMPEAYIEYGQKWADLNPGWEVIDWDWDMLREANLANWQLAESCGTDEFPANAGAGKQDTAVQVQRADILSYSLVFKFGGVYVNCDMEPMQPIEPWLEALVEADDWENRYTAATSWEIQDKALSNAFLWAENPQDPFWRECVLQLPKRVKALPGQAMNIQTGPWLLTEVFDQRLVRELNVPTIGEIDHQADLFVFAADLFHPYLWNEVHREREEHPDAITIHHWGHRKPDRALWPDEVTGDGMIVPCWIAPGEVRNEFMTSVMTLWSNLGHKIPNAITRNSGPLIDVMRNRLVREFLKSPHEWMLMIDADMMLEPGCVETLIEAADPIERPIVGGLAFGRDMDGVVFPTMYRLSDQHGNFARAENVPPDVLIEVDATGCAILLVHRSVFEAIQQQGREPYVWFQETQIGDKVVGEDITFCLRARHAGFPIHVHTGAKTAHLKDVGLDLALHEKWRQDNHYVITGTGRSGTRWMADLMTNFAMATSHEYVFDANVHDYIDDVNWGGQRGDASWMAAPHLRLAKLDRVKVIQVFRHPLATMSSMIGSGFYADVPEDEFEDVWWPYRLYQEQYLFNGDLAPEWDKLTPLERAMHMYVRWNEMILPYSDIKMRLEDLQKAEAVQEMLKLLGYGRALDECEAVLAATPKTNYLPETPPQLTWNDIPDSEIGVQLRKMASDIGYLEELTDGRNDQQP